MNGMSPVKSGRIHRWTVKTMPVGALLFCVMGPGLSQTRPEPYTIFKQYIGLKVDEIASIEGYTHRKGGCARTCWLQELSSGQMRAVLLTDKFEATANRSRRPSH